MNYKIFYSNYNHGFENFECFLLLHSHFYLKRTFEDLKTLNLNRLQLKQLLPVRKNGLVG